jgi:hypothetical protein
MRVNVGTADRAVRIVVGLALLSLILILDGNVRWWGLVGLQPLVTGLIGWCPLYIPLGIDTSGPARRTEIGATGLWR